MSNPFDSDLARANSAYARFEDNRLVRAEGQERPSELEEQIHAAFRARILDARFSCVGARAAFNSGAYRLGVYGEMTGSGALAGLARDLFAFTQEQDALGSDFTTFVAVFCGADHDERGAV